LAGYVAYKGGTPEERRIGIRRGEDNIKQNREELGCERVVSIELALDRFQWWAFVNIKEKLRVR